MKRWRWSSLLGLLMLLTGCASWGTTAQPTALPTVRAPAALVAEGHLVPARYVSLSFVSGGPLAEVLVVEGQDVQAGQVLARLATQPQAEAALRAAEVELLAAQKARQDLDDLAELQRSQAQAAVSDAERSLVQAQADLAKLDTQQYRDRLDDLEADLADAEQELKDAQEEFDRYRGLNTDNQTYKDAEKKRDDAQDRRDALDRELRQWRNQRDAANAAVTLAEAALEDANRHLKDWSGGVPKEERDLAEARLAAAQAQVQAAQTALDQQELRAPFAGRVVQVNVEVGEVAAPARPILILADFSTWYVETKDLTELDVVRLTTGQAVTVQADALPAHSFAGEIERIDQLFAENAGDITYPVRIRLLETDPHLRWGMTVSVTFLNPAQTP
jgi:multidrug resistance efflux pump